MMNQVSSLNWQEKPPGIILLIDQWEKLTYQWLCVTKGTKKRITEIGKKKNKDDIQIPLKAASCQHDSVVSLTLT